MSTYELGQGGKNTKSQIEVTAKMIEAGAEILMASAHCEMSLGIAEDLAEEVLRRALNFPSVDDQLGNTADDR